MQETTGHIGSGHPGRLRPVLSLRDLVLYGIVLVQPIAPVGVFGIAGRMSGGHVATTILLAMIAMLFTAWSYGRMAALYPSAGSAYAYTSKTLHPQIGFLTGWAMFLDYLIIPVINVIYVSLTLQRLFPQVPYVVWVGLATGLITAFNLRGVAATARLDTVLVVVMFVVIAVFFHLTVRFLMVSHGWSGLISLDPFYNPATFRLGAVAQATSLAALTYIGFDGVTNLAEDVRSPEKTVPRATVLVCLLMGLLSTAEVYLGQRAWPDFNSFANPETAFMDVCSRVGGAFLFQAMGFVLVIACFGSALAGQVGAARLLYGMGRDGVLPRSIFGRLDRRANPVWNLVIIGAVAFAGALLIGYERAAELLNFGAFLAFIGVNACAFRQFFLRRKRSERRLFADALAPGLGFGFCLFIWVNLPAPAKIAGGVWLAIGVVYAAVRSRTARARTSPLLSLPLQDGDNERVGHGRTTANPDRR